MKAAEANLTFPVMIIMDEGAFIAGAHSNYMLSHPHRRHLESGCMLNAELVDAVGRRFKVTGIERLKAEGWLRPPLRFFARYEHVSYDLQPLPSIGFDALKARLLSFVERYPDVWAGWTEEVASTLRCLKAATSLDQIIQEHDSGDFIETYKPCGPAVSRSDDQIHRPSFTDLRSISLAEASLAFPIIGLTPAPRLIAAESLNAFTRIDGRQLRRSELVGTELIDARWRRFRILAVHDRGLEWPWGLWHLAALVRNMCHRVDYDLQPLEVTSLEQARVAVVQAFRADPAGMSHHFDRKLQARYLARIRSAKDIEELGGWVPTSPFAYRFVQDP